MASVGYGEEAAKAGASHCQASKPFVCVVVGGFPQAALLNYWSYFCLVGYSGSCIWYKE